MTSMNDEDDAELCTNTLGPRKNPNDLLRSCTGRDIVVRRLDLHHHVANTTANQIGFMPKPAEFANDVDCRVGFHVRYDNLLSWREMDAIQRSRLLPTRRLIDR